VENATQLTLPLVFGNDSLNLTFSLDGKKRYISDLVLTFVPKSQDFPGHRSPDTPVVVKMENQTLFELDEDKSYLCNSDVDFTSGGTTVTFAQVELDAFRKQSDGTEFRAAKECEKDEQINDLVPIAVGCALLALVVIVLIAYFIGRRRSRRLAYQSV